MGKLPNGKPNVHVNASTGANKGFMDFYTTEYSGKQGKEGFLPRIGHHAGTGYQSNFRPGVYYTRKLDELDNPSMGHTLKDNYRTVTMQSYRRSEGSDGKDPLSKDVSNRNTGFTSNEKSFKNEWMAPKSAPAGLMGLSSQNNPYLTEKRAQFTRKNPLVDLNGKSIGRRREETGFTQSKNIEPITYRPEESFDGGCFMSRLRPTGQSVTTTSFPQAQISPNNSDKFGNVNEKAQTDNGFTRFIRPTAALTGSEREAYTKLGDLNEIDRRRIKKQDPSEYLNILHPYRHVTVNNAIYQGKHVLDSSLVDKVTSSDVGGKEDSGHVANNKAVDCSPMNMSRNKTTYCDQFYNKNTTFADNPFKAGQSLPPASDGFTKNENVYSGEYDKGKEVASLTSYVARSLRARDPFFQERHHENKKILKAC